MKKKLFALSGIFLIVLVIAGLWATKATGLLGAEQIDPGATSLATELSMQKMAEESSLIFMGECLETKSVWNNRRLFTLATVAVKETFKGDPGNKVTVALPGGIDSNREIPVAMTYAGAPQISLGEQVFLFLTGPGQDAIPDSYEVTGFAQGKYSVVGDNEGEQVVTRDLIRAPMEKGVGMTRGNIQAVRLSDLKERLRSYLK